jgi:hypothetical protein
MTGGKALLYSIVQGQTLLAVGSGTRSVGTLSLTNDAQLIVSNFVAIGQANSTGTLTVAGNAVVRHSRGSTRFQVGIESAAQGTVNVCENGVLDAVGNDGINVGGYGNNARGVLNIDGGRVEAGAGVTLCRSTAGKGGVGELTLSGGVLGSMGLTSGYGLLMGSGDNASGAARAYATVSGGLLDISRNMWNSKDHQNGIMVGLVRTLGACSWGELRISGGTVTNSGQFAVGLGLGGTGFVYQTGGTVQQGVGRSGVTCYQTTIGWGGGWGSYTLSGGTFESAKPVYIGGVTAADLGYTPLTVIFTNASVGTLRVDGGSFTLTNQTLHLGRYGAGTLIIGSNGVCSAKDIVLTNNTQSTLRFELGPNGPGTLTAGGALIVRAGARLEVDSTAYRGSAIWLKLIDCATRTTAFAPENVTVTGPGVVRQDRNEDLWLFIRHGTFLLLY